MEPATIFLVLLVLIVLCIVCLRTVRRRREPDLFTPVRRASVTPPPPRPVAIDAASDPQFTAGRPVIAPHRPCFVTGLPYAECPCPSHSGRDGSRNKRNKKR